MPSPPTMTQRMPRDRNHATALSIWEALPTCTKTGSFALSTSRIASARWSCATVGSAERAARIACISSKNFPIRPTSSSARRRWSSGDRRDTRLRAGSTIGQVITRPTEGSIVSSSGVHPSRRIAEALPETSPPSGTLTEIRIPAARATASRSLSGLIATAGVTSGRRSPTSLRSSVTSTWSVSTRPSDDGRATKPGDTCMPFASTTSHPSGSAGAPGPTDMMRPPSKSTCPFSMTGVSALAV